MVALANWRWWWWWWSNFLCELQQHFLSRWTNTISRFIHELQRNLIWDWLNPIGFYIRQNWSSNPSKCPWKKWHPKDLTITRRNERILAHKLRNKEPNLPNYQKSLAICSRIALQPLKIDGANTILSFWGPAYFSGAFAVSFRGAYIYIYNSDKMTFFFWNAISNLVKSILKTHAPVDLIQTTLYGQTKPGVFEGIHNHWGFWYLSHKI